MKHQVLIVVATSLLIPFSQAKESAEDSCRSAAQLYADGDLDNALEDARWCVTLMEQEQQAKTNTYFKDEISGYSGSELEQQNAMGMNMVSREYTKGDKRINVTLNSGNSGAAMQAFSALAQFGMQAGAGQKVRIQKRTAMTSVENNNASVSVTLRNGGMLMFESSSASLEEVVAFAKEFPIAEMDESQG
ncbi:hypothetical protein OPS25_04260 [Alteromonas ponticola]|uniref:DUF4252 domain-containing protein n=1 Tax=Alteromonas aquimaris TaxID=2998417 RepID=A0ABT3P6K8_9ALTE|nr:hypothetical protein [Alteromonas aquimaris]MCW8107716.1 hypothetical protein [Alteromonas aquimaris]